MSTADVTIGVEDNLQHTWKLLDKSIWCESYRHTKRSRLLTDSKRCSAKMYGPAIVLSAIFIACGIMSLHSLFCKK